MKWRSERGGEGKFLGVCVSPHIPLSPHSLGPTGAVLNQSLIEIKFWVSRGAAGVGRGGLIHPSETVAGPGRHSKGSTQLSRAPLRLGGRTAPRPPARTFLLPTPTLARAPLPLAVSRPPRYQATSCPGGKQPSLVTGRGEGGCKGSLSSRNEPG